MFVDCIGHNIGHYEIKEPFYDGILRLMGHDNFYLQKVLIAEREEDVYTLDRIVAEYPDVYLVMFDDALAGAIFRRDYSDGKWYKTGETMGYA